MTIQNSGQPDSSITILEKDSRVFVIPVWFMKVASWAFGLLSALFITWAGWMTVSVYSINTTLAVNAQLNDRVLKLETQLEAVSNHLQDHVADPSIHSNLSLRIEANEKAIERLEKKP